MAEFEDSGKSLDELQSLLSGLGDDEEVNMDQLNEIVLMMVNHIQTLAENAMTDVITKSGDQANLEELIQPYQEVITTTEGVRAQVEHYQELRKYVELNPETGMLDLAEYVDEMSDAEKDLDLDYEYDDFAEVPLIDQGVIEKLMTLAEKMQSLN